MKQFANIRKMLLVATMCLMSLTTYATDYWVTTSGVDNSSRNGNSSNPWRSIRYAITRITGTGHTIRLGNGTFTEGGQITLPSGISLVGGGQTETTIKVNFYYNMLDFPQAASVCSTPDGSYDSADEKFVIQINGSNQRLTGFTLDGQSKQCHGGIFMADGSNVVFDNLKIIGFRFSAIWLGKCRDTEIKYCFIKDNAFGNKRTSQGDILLWDATNLSIHHNTIEEIQPTSYGSNVGAYGIKAWAPYFTTFCVNGFGDQTIKTVASGVKIYDNRITVLEKGTWNGGQAPGITIEFHKFSYQNCEIYNNTVNNHISLVGCDKASDGFQVSGKTMRVHHNIFDLGDKYSYGVENDILKSEIDHNYFYKGYYGVAQFNDGKTNEGQSIHHNVFFDPKENQGVISFHRYGPNFTFVNNTVYTTKTSKLSWILKLCNGSNCSGMPPKVPGAQIKNNILASTVSFGAWDIYNEAIFDAPAISNNLFFNMDPFGSATVIGNPQLVASGNKPQPYFELKSGSPAIDRGVIVSGLTDGYSGSNPDIGAYEFQSSTNPTGFKLEAENYNTMQGVIKNATYIGGCDNNEWVAFTNVNLASGYQTFKTRAAIPGTNQSIELRLNSTTGTLIGNFTLQSTGSYTTYTEQNFTLSSGTGVQTIYFVFKGGFGVGNFDWFEFSDPESGTLRMSAEDSQVDSPERLIKIYPNPSKGRAFYMQVSNPNQSKVSLQSSLGTAIPVHVKAQGEQLLLITPKKELQAGIYLITLRSQTYSVTKKIMIEK